jgi:Ca2+-binding EF-hand superfamily protein
MKGKDMRLLPLILLATACSPAPALAQQFDGSRIVQQLERADTNGDGSISKPEFRAHRQAQFDRIDRNGDGFMADGDIPKRLKNRMPDGLSTDQMIKQFDKDGDGKVSETEFVDGPALIFDRVDANADGMVAKAEMEAARAAFAAR